MTPRFKDVELEASGFGLPDFETYYGGVKEFLKTNKGLSGLLNRENSDNTNGVLDVSWAFYKKKKRRKCRQTDYKKGV